MYELVIRCDDDGVVIEPRGRLDDDADRHIRECLAAARHTGVTTRVRVTEPSLRVSPRGPGRPVPPPP